MQEQPGMNTAVSKADEELLASLGYKQEFRREFTGLEVRLVVQICDAFITSRFCRLLVSRSALLASYRLSRMSSGQLSIRNAVLKLCA